MIIEHYRDQDLNELRKKVIHYYKLFTKHYGDSDKVIYYENWHPEMDGAYNDTWFLIKLLERFGYHTYTYDTVLYTSSFVELDGAGKTIEGDGITLNQAVCNMFVCYGFEYDKRINHGSS